MENEDDMTGSSDDARDKAEAARRNLIRLAKAKEFEAYEQAELDREAAAAPRLSPAQKTAARQAGQPDAMSAGRRKGIPSQRGK